MFATHWYPTAAWKPGETIVTETLPWDLGPSFRLGLAVLGGTHEEGSEIDAVADFRGAAERLPITAADPEVTLFHGDSWAQIGAFTRGGRYLVPGTSDPAASPMDANFAEGIHLIESQISNRKSQVSVVLEWVTAVPIPRDYTVFVHLVAPDGTIVAQSDAQPSWVVPWPTSHWLPGHTVLDGHRLPLPANLAPGRYQVRAGLYYWETLEKLPLLDKTMLPISDYVVLGEIQIEP
jgi:hypothetical protein